MASLDGRVCLVTGGSRGVGRGVVLGLLEAGAIVHFTGRTQAEGGHPDGLDRAGSLDTVLRDAAALPGEAVAHRCDHAEDRQTEAVVDAVLARHGRLDCLVNNAWGGYERMVEGTEFTWPAPFWEQPLWRWDVMVGTGLRAAFVAARRAAPALVSGGGGLIVNISFWAAQVHEGNLIYGVAKAGADKMAADMAHELRPHGVAALALYPGLVRTEAVMKNARFFDLSNSESPQFIGRVVAGLLTDPALLAKSGLVHVAAALAAEYGIADIDGRMPQPLSREGFVAGIQGGG